MYAIGTEEEAGFILYWHLMTQKSSAGYWNYPEPPEGWARLGSGCYRTAYLAPSGVVYKVQERYAKDDEQAWQSNYSEMRNLREYALTKLPKGCRLPRWNAFQFGWKTVIAMEKFDKLLQSATWEEHDKMYHRLKRELLEALNYGITDTHDANLAIDSKTNELVIIDWGG